MSGAAKAAAAKGATRFTGRSRPRLHQPPAQADFNFPAHIPIDEEHTLEQLLKAFTDLKDGLPELIKNSKDQYLRLGVEEPEKRQIIVLANTSTRSLGVLDFAGAGKSDFEHWAMWSGKTKTDVADVEAGHGNGGKAFMVHGATEHSFLESCSSGRHTRMGYRNDDPDVKYKPGYGKVSGVQLHDVREPDPLSWLESFLDLFQATLDDLPAPAQDTLLERKAFTGVYLTKVKSWSDRRKDFVERNAKDLPLLIASHGQTALSVDTCQIWVIVDGELLTPTPIKTVAIDPRSGFETAREFDMPSKLPDPESGEEIDTSSGALGRRFLRLQTSKKNMQLSEDLKPRNVIRVWNGRNNVASLPLATLGVLSPSINFIYGELHCGAITEDHIAGAERIHLNNTPLTRAIQAWMHSKIADLAEGIAKAQLAETRPRDRQQASAVLRGIRKLMRKYLESDVPGDEPEDTTTDGERGQSEDGRRRRRGVRSFAERVDTITFERNKEKIAIAAGTSVPLIVSCFERQPDGTTKPVRATDLAFVSDPPGHLKVGKGNSVTCDTPGLYRVHVQTCDGSVTSNEVVIEVITAERVEIFGPDEAMRQGERTKVRVCFHTPSGMRDDILLQAGVDEPEMGLIGRSGRFTAGLKEGIATIRVRYGALPTHHSATVVHIGPDRVPERGYGGETGSDIPEILLCGEVAPGMDEYPEEQRTHPGGPEFPTIIEEPQFRGVVWINPNSTEAVRVRRSRGGTSGVGGIATQTFADFVALKCFDVLKRLWVRQKIRDRSVTETQFIMYFAEAETECAEFIDAAWEISGGILSGQISSP